MSDTYVKLVVLAAISDGEIQAEELALINGLRVNFAAMRGIDEQDFNNAVADVYNKVSAGMELHMILEVLGKGLSTHEKNVGYALAMEVVRSNFQYVDGEKTFIGTLIECWDVEADVIEAVNLSAHLRYGEG